MKNIRNILLILLISKLSVFAYSSKVSAAYGIGIFDKNGNGENIQHVRNSKNDYNGECYSKIVVFGKLFTSSPDVRIGNSKGHFVKKIAIYNKQNIKIAEEMTFKHYNVSKGYLQIKINNKLFDTKVFIK